MTSGKISCWQIFRLVFVIFSLYLLRDAFYRWDGFKFYASFSEFLPSIALATILWTVVGFFIGMLIWVPLRGLEWFCLRRGWKDKMNYGLMFLGSSVLLGAAAWKGKRLIWPVEQTTVQAKSAVFLCAIFLAIFLTWRFHNKFERWMEIIQRRITPLVWIFGICFILSVPLVAYYTLGKETDKAALQKISKSSISDRKQPNIILVIFDTLTARDMSVYGYHKPTTPFITEWAKEASLFTAAQAESNFTTPTTASLMTGKRLWTHQTYHLGGSRPVRSDIESLPLVLKDNGYYNMAFVVNPWTSVKTLNISNSFEIAPLATEFSTPVSLSGVIDKLLYLLFGEKIRLYDWVIKENFVLGKFLNIISRDFSKTIVPPEEAFNKFLEVIDENPPEPFFAWIHLFPPHFPYLPPEPYMGMYDSSPRFREFNDQYRFRGSGLKEFTKEQQLTVNILRSRYDEFITYSDKVFEDFLAQLTKRNKLKNTVIILSADHGESFEHAYLAHGHSHLYEQVTHIPLIIKNAGQIKGRIIDNLVEQIDIPSTILDLADIPVPLWMEGRSLVPLMRGKTLPSMPVFSMNFQPNQSRRHQITKGTIAVWEGDYKLIHYIEGKKSLLFNLKQDPDELNNLFDREPETGQRLLALIKDNLEKANERISRGE